MSDHALAPLAEFIEEGGRKVGASIKCPRCGMEGAVFFKNPIGGGEPHGKVLWQRDGETFETMTLNPSVRMYEHFHGWVKKGVLELLADEPCKHRVD